MTKVAQTEELSYKCCDLLNKNQYKFRVKAINSQGAGEPNTLPRTVVAKDPWGKRRAGFTATTTINRKEFGVSYNQVLDQGGLALSEEVAVTIEIEATTAIATSDVVEARA